MKLTMKEDPEEFEQIAKALKDLGKKQVKIGLPPSAGGRFQFILAIQEHGSPINRIPARPVIQPALSSPEVRDAIAEGLAAAVEAAWNGDETGAQAGLEAAGQAGADGIRAYIDAGGLAPNAAITVSGGWMRSRVSGKTFCVAGKGKNTPLVDTGALYGAFGYEVSE